MQELYTHEKLNEAVAKDDACLVYFSTDSCNVCKVLKPKVTQLVEQEYPKIKTYYVNIEKVPEGAARHSVFTVPTLTVFFDGKETFRKSRNFGINELSQALEKPYHLFFS